MGRHAKCPCAKEPCGLVNIDTASPECSQHGIDKFKTMRQMHAADECPASATATPSPPKERS